MSGVRRSILGNRDLHSGGENLLICEFLQLVLRQGFQVERDRFLYIRNRIFHAIPLRLAAGQVWTEGVVTVGILFNDYAELMHKNK
jgi:hypothetical protein